MKSSNHLILFSFCIMIWLIFFLLGLTNNYYQSWNFNQHLINTADVILLMWPLVYVILKHISGGRYLVHSIWFAFYASVPFMLLDFIYLHIIKGYDFSYLANYWYLTIFYFVVWIEMPLIGLYLQRKKK
jgi:hypothetical protein